MQKIWPQMDRNKDDKVTFDEYYNYLQRYYINKGYSQKVIWKARGWFHNDFVLIARGKWYFTKEDIKIYIKNHVK